LRAALIAFALLLSGCGAGSTPTLSSGGATSVATATPGSQLISGNAAAAKILRPSDVPSATAQSPSDQNVVSVCIHGGTSIPGALSSNAQAHDIAGVTQPNSSTSPVEADEELILIFGGLADASAFEQQVLTAVQTCPHQQSVNIPSISGTESQIFTPTQGSVAGWSGLTAVSSTTLTRQTQQSAVDYLYYVSSRNAAVELDIGWSNATDSPQLHQQADQLAATLLGRLQNG